ncbi:MAG TPA: GlsB/YeaQ/YmgE family stress response membrane protein [Rhodanobacter sp.]|jgi:Predicted membrane protein
MTATSLIILLVIGAIAGWLAGLIVRGFGFGLVGNIVVGIIGALLAGWLLPALGVGFTLGSPLVTSIVYALIGAIVLLVIVGLFRRAPHV